MKRTAAALALAALAACRPASHAPAPSPTPSATPAEPDMPPLSTLPVPDRIGVTGGGPWGANWHEWLIDRSGAVHMRAVLHDGSQHTSFTISPADYLAIRAMLGDLERRQGRQLPYDCNTDQGGEGITWHYRARTIDLLIDGGCSGGEYDAGFAAVAAVRQKLEALAATAPDRKVTLTKP